MAMDPELKVLLAALVEGQTRLSAGMDALAGGQRRTEAAIEKLALQMRRSDSIVSHLATATEAALTRLTARVDDFGRRVTKGFTRAAETDRRLDDQLHEIVARVRKIERTGSRHPPRKG